MRLVFWTGFWIFLLDQASKYLVVHILNLRQLGEIDVLPPLLNLRMAWNYGINFGLFAQNGDLTRWVLVVVALAISVAVIWWVINDPPGTIGKIAAGFLIGGALGNVIDRLLYGAVADFLNMSCCGIDNPYAFNVADIAIFIGAFGLVLFTGGKKPA
ncbi:MAG: signal peptidase II [Rhodobacteraceae bacterium]|jgi:signal peptidase II|nr:signal peptidase II [Paracoccaceae bacterium]